ncbi:MAG: acetyl-CoA carboxylase, biotin carboxyl carrier protein [Cytophagaceae bacterium SCN 52-12]|nr:MAG: acetyl-CoA carboxylase, biotin carboxyl carrier protein [Cytophagaceae bacterium SCN 52-12]
METKEIQKLLDFIASSGLDEVIIETSELKVKVRRNSTVQAAAAAPAPQASAAPAAPAAVAAPAAKKELAAPEAAAAEKSDAKLVTIKSPMIGTFYRASSPESPSFVNVGDEIRPGKVVCVIEAMKLFNEIESELSGKIVKVLVENATPVEFDQPLFQVELI